MQTPRPPESWRAPNDAEKTPSSTLLEQWILRGSGPVLPCCTDDTGLISIEIAIAVVPGAHQQDIVVHQGVAARRPGDILELVALAQGFLRRPAGAVTQNFQRRRVGASLRCRIASQSTAQIAQSLDGARFGPRCRVAGTLRQDVPEEAPDRSGHQRQKHAPAQENRGAAAFFLRLARRRKPRFGEVGAAVRADFGGLVDLALAFAAGEHGRRRPGTRGKRPSYATPRGKVKS